MLLNTYLPQDVCAHWCTVGVAQSTSFPLACASAQGIVTTRRKK